MEFGKIISQEDKIKNETLTYVNHSGFLLEEKANQLIKNIYPTAKIQRNIPIKTPKIFHEIDLFVEIEDKHFVIECKKFISESDCVFLHNINNVNQKKIINSNTNKQHIIGDISKYPSVDYVLPKFNIMNGATKDTRTKNDDNNETTNKKIFDAANHLATSLEIVVKIDNYSKYAKQGSAIEKMFANIGKSFNWNTSIYPILLTNKELYLIEYENSDINEKGDLTDFKIRKVPFLIYDHPTVIYNSETPINYSKLSSIGYTRTEKQNTISIFIVTVTHLHEFLKDIIGK